MSDTTEPKTVEPVADTTPDVDKLKAENFAQREKRRALEARVAELEPMAAKLTEYEAAQMTAAEKAATDLKTAQDEAATARAEADAAKRDAAFGLAVNQYNVDPAHLPLLDAAKASLPYGDAEALAAMLAPYARKATAPNHKVINPASGGVPDLANLDNLSMADRIAAYGASLKGK